MKVALVITSTMCLILLGTLLFSGGKEDEQELDQLIEDNKTKQVRIDSLEAARETHINQVDSLESENNTHVDRVDSLEVELTQIAEKYESTKSSVVGGDTSVIVDVLSNF